jgi:nuclear pore complex protein Nup155
LPLQCANDWDSDLQGRDYWLAGAGSGLDPRREAYESRTKCYDLVLASLKVFDDRLASATSEAAGACRIAAT